MTEEKKPPKKEARQRIKIDLDDLERLAHLGLTREQIADALYISVDTLYKHQREDPEVAKILRRGKAKSIAYAAGKLMTLIEQGNLSAIIFYLKTQGRWSETQNIELTGKGGGAIEVNNHSVENLSTEQLLEIARMNDKESEN